jgi:predicted nucleotidyltransferase
MNDDARRRLEAAADDHPFPLLFAAISGAHLYGFASADSDYDLRGCHVLPPSHSLGLDPGPWTIEVERAEEDGFELDLVTHDALKFFRMMLTKNAYVLEQLHSPLVVRATPEHEELKAIARDCVTRFHHHHYLGFAATQWRLFDKERPRRIKPLLYVYRALLTGIHLMRSGEVEANLPRLNESARLSHVDELIARKVAGRERDTLDDADASFHHREYERLRAELEAAGASSRLPERPTARDALDDLLLRLRGGSSR